MPHRILTAEELPAYLHMSKGDIDRLLRESDLPHEIRGGRLVFRRRAVDEWASKRILQLPEKRLEEYHERSSRGTQEFVPGAALIPHLLRPEDIDLALASKTVASTIRDMVALADRSGRVTDRQELMASVKEREAMCSTALPGGFALLHARHHLPYQFDGSFLVLGRTIQWVPFGAEDGRPTRVFFLICCQDDRLHLHALARLCMLAMKTDVVARLMDAENSVAAFESLVAAEKSVLPGA